MNPSRVLVAGIGNIFLGDDAFGIEVVQRLAQRPQPAGVRVVDFGIRGLDLTYALLDGCDAVVLVDAIPRGGSPGTLYVLEPEVEGSAGPESGDLMLDAHSLDPTKVLRLATALGSSVAEARNRAYHAIDLIDWPEGFCRRDIGWRAMHLGDAT